MADFIENQGFVAGMQRPDEDPALDQHLSYDVLIHLRPMYTVPSFISIGYSVKMCIEPVTSALRL
ncbi:MAG TPA: hypothetical protein DEP53_11725 [Bacteroidetes bacterium]|nr:hypothetical protein [Bacteroidota bacterium]